MHFLDLIMYFVCAGVILGILSLSAGNQFNKESGGILVGLSVMFFYTLLYIFLFAIWPDWNWSDFDYNSIKNWFKW